MTFTGWCGKSPGDLEHLPARIHDQCLITPLDDALSTMALATPPPALHRKQYHTFSTVFRLKFAISG
jgi:hypothetical protein